MVVGLWFIMLTQFSTISYDAWFVVVLGHFC